MIYINRNKSRDFLRLWRKENEWYVSSFFYCWHQMPDEEQLRSFFLAHGLRSYSPSWYERNSSSLRTESSRKEGGSDLKLQGSPHSVTHFLELGTTVKVLASSKTALPAEVKKMFQHMSLWEALHTQTITSGKERLFGGPIEILEELRIYLVFKLCVCIYIYWLYYIFVYINEVIVIKLYTLNL